MQRNVERRRYTVDEIMLAAASVVGEPRHVIDVELKLMVDEDFDAWGHLYRIGRAKSRRSSKRESAVDAFLRAGEAIAECMARARQSPETLVRVLALAANARAGHPDLARDVRSAWIRLFPECEVCHEGHYRRRRSGRARFGSCALSFSRGSEGCGATVPWAQYKSRKAQLVLALLLDEPPPAGYAVQVTDDVLERRRTAPTKVRARSQQDVIS